MAYAQRVKVSATRLRADLYQLLDRVLETGEALEVTRSEGTLVIKRSTSNRRGASRKKKPSTNPDLIVGDPDELVHFDWSRFWKPRL